MTYSLEVILIAVTTVDIKLFIFNSQTNMAYNNIFPVLIVQFVVLQPTLGHTKPDLLLFSNTVDHIIMAVTGILVSLYALHVELQKDRNPDYVAYCDIHNKASCTRVLTSE